MRRIFTLRTCTHFRKMNFLLTRDIYDILYKNFNVKTVDENMQLTELLLSVVVVRHFSLLLRNGWSLLVLREHSRANTRPRCWPSCNFPSDIGRKDFSAAEKYPTALHFAVIYDPSELTSTRCVSFTSERCFGEPIFQA